MATDTTFLIIGGGLAGAKAAEGARTSGYDGRIVLVAEEATQPYERPPLSKGVLRGEAEPETTRVHDPAFYDAQSVELMLGESVDHLDVAARTAQLASGSSIAFDTALLATGAAPRRLDLPGTSLDGVHYLRTVGDSEQLSAAIRQAGRVAVIGAGWIGSEVTASARQMGADVVLIEPAALPLIHVVGERVGEMFRQLHADHGVDLRLGVGFTELRGNGSVAEVVLSDGRVEPADVVVIGVGVSARTELARDSGLTVERGVVVDEFLQSSAPGIYAAGDVAEAWHSRYQRRLQIEHWANALEQGPHAAANATGQHEPYTLLPYFFSDQYDLGLEYTGNSSPGDDVVIRGDLESREFIAFYHRDGVVSAAMPVNTWDVIDDLKAVVSAGVPIDLGRLADSDVPLTELPPN
ncbi:MAG TPA: FAD-dependent oxidoreductase [Mycobacteriales bacterium]|nr:FAD-dependent oxidoreductase [Mycobacteriales bacterium]